MSRRSHVPGLGPFALLLLLALAARMVAVAVSWDYVPHVDPADYHRHASSIAAGDGYPESVLTATGGPSALRPPLYPLFLAGLYRLPGPDIGVARLAQAVLGAVTAGLIGLLARRLFGPRAGLAALVVAALYPPFVLLPTALLAENLFLPLMVAALLAALRMADARSGALTGLVTGLAALVRQNAAALVLPFLYAAARRSGGWRSTVALLTAAALAVVPWTVRNAVDLHAFVPVATQTGVLLAGTYNDASREDPVEPGAWRDPRGAAAYAALFERDDLTEAELDRELRRRATHYALDHPGYVVAAGLRNALRLAHLGGRRYERFAAADFNYSEPAQAVSRYGFWALALLALAGASIPAVRRAPGWLWAIPLLLATPVFIAGLVRYRLPIDPFLILPAAVALATAAGRLPSWRVA